MNSATDFLLKNCSVTIHNVISYRKMGDPDKTTKKIAYFFNIPIS